MNSRCLNDRLFLYETLVNMDNRRMMPIQCKILPGLLLAVFMVSGTGAVQAAPDETMRDRVQACDACHARSPESAEEEIYYPSINAKPVEYLYQQLLNFKEGRRANPTMKHMLAYLSPEYLHEIAAWYAEQPAPEVNKVSDGSALDPVRAARGALLVQQGNGSQPACAACHGSDLKGDGIAIPGLQGLSATYLTAQLGAWQAGSRHAREPDCMAEVARSLSGEDIEIVAQWIAHAQNADLVANEALEFAELPLECGAVQ